MREYEAPESIEIEVKRNWSSSRAPLVFGTVGVVVFFVFLLPREGPTPLLVALFAGIWLFISIAILVVAARRNHQQIVWARLSLDGVFDKDNVFHPWDSISEIRHIFGVLYIGSKHNASPAVALNPKYLGHEQVASAEKFFLTYAPDDLLTKIK